MALAAMMPSIMHAANIEVVATQTVNTTPFGPNVRAITTNTTWTKNNNYILRDKVFVTNGATLTIEPGTKIYSTLDDKGTGTKDDDAFGAIVIVRGAKIQANGTAAEPIVMTTIDELEAQTATDLDGNSSVADAPTTTTAGRWGGLVVLGNAPIANFGPGPVNIGEDRIEGFQPAASSDLDADGRADVIEYGGAVAADNSGSMTYISIRHGGYVYAAGTEINGLTLGGVGSGTTINHIEVFANADDGIEFFGGTVNTSNIVLAFNQDDSFDIDQGYSGTNQFWFAIQNPFLEDGVTSAQDNGGEWDGVTGTINDSPAASAPIIYNATFIGSGVTGPLGTDRGNNALFIDDRFKGKIYNSVFDDFREDFIEASSDAFGTGLVFANNTIGRFGGGTPGTNLTYLNGAGAANMVFDAAGVPINGNSSGGVNPLYRNYVRNAGLELVTIDPRPSTSSPLLPANGATIQAGAPVAANFRGAFGSTNWATGWTRVSTIGKLIGDVVSSVDTDGDGISDAVESANTALGLNPLVFNGTPATILANVYTTASILDLRTAGQTTVQAVGPNVTLSLPVFKSGTLDNPWIPAGNLSLTIPKDGDKQFYRIQVEGAD